MNRIRFTKIFTDHDRLRDDVIEGFTHDWLLPTVGKSFIFWTKSRDGDAEKMREVNTSPITKITARPPEGPTTYYFETESRSVYRVEILENEAK